MKILKSILVVVIALALAGFTLHRTKDETSLKCLVQLINYQGEGAYMVVSLINPDGKYEKTLYVLGEDEEWYHDLTQWFAFFETGKEKIDAISGATIAGGERTVCVLGFDKTKLDAGYKLRFETAVENQKYYTEDVQIDLTSANLTGKFEGSGYIRYIRLIPN